MFAVAIDGPAGAGKSSIARYAAAELGFIHVDTGALYRTVALFMLRAGVDIQKEDEVQPQLANISIDLCYMKDGQHVLLNGKDVSGAIRTPEISMASSVVSAYPSVRKFLLGLQFSLAEKNNVVMDGRDIGTVVLPHAQVKIFLTASSEERARRRYNELQEKGAKDTYEDVLADVRRRDLQDSTRAVAPLKPAEDAVILDTTDLTLQASADMLVNIVRKCLENTQAQ